MVIGHTEEHDDNLSIQDWTLVLTGKVGKIAEYAQVMRTDAVPMDEDNALEWEISALAGLCHSFLESIDRRRERDGRTDN